MKKRFLLFALALPLVGLTGCGSYSKTDVTLSNYKDYFEVYATRTGSAVADFDSANNKWVAPKDTSTNFKTLFYAQFKVKDDKLENTYYSNVKFSFVINLYYGKSSITAEDQPTHTVNFESQLHHSNETGKELYQVGFNLWCDTMYYLESNDKTSSYEISYLKNDYATSDYCNYYREIILKSVSGTVETGGLTGANTYHCN